MARVKRSVVEFPKRVTVTVGPVVGDGPNRYCRVEPSQVAVSYGGTVTFKCADGCGPLEIYVPTPSRERALFPRSGSVLKVPGTRRGRSFTVVVRKHEAPHPVEYPYAVYCRGCHCFGKGSLPRMMVGP